MTLAVRANDGPDLFESVKQCKGGIGSPGCDLVS